ncbi:MAG: thiamine diphosphokinase [Anaerolineales bacterium]|nr:thiamine diphosphokinase [Anaerolineales bacterium]
MKRVIIFANGELPEPERVRAFIQPDDFIIAADGGARHCWALKLTPQLAVGDFDSLTAAELAKLEQAGITLKRFPRDKDETDLELALLEAARLGAEKICVLGALGGRLDMTLANLQLLTHPALAHISLEVRAGGQTAWLLRPPGGPVRGQVGDTVSLLPLGGAADGITTRGLRYPLNGETLTVGPARGVSNALTQPEAYVGLQAGLLLIIHTENT